MKREYIFPALKITLFTVQGPHQHCSPLPYNKHFYRADLFLHYLVISFAQRGLTWEILYVWKIKFVYNEQLIPFSSSLSFSPSVPDLCKPNQQWQTHEMVPDLLPVGRSNCPTPSPHLQELVSKFSIQLYIPCYFLSFPKFALNSVKNF